MAGSLGTCGTWADSMVNHSDNGFEGVEVSGLNGAFLMSLMEELQDQVVLEDSDEERLNSVIQSLEAEINGCATSSSDDEQDHSCMESDDDHSDRYESISNGENSQSCRSGQVMESSGNHDDYCSISFDDMNMNEWVSMEAEAPSSPGHELNYYMYHFGEEMISTDNHHSYYGVSIDQEQSEYNSLLWQETNYEAVI